LARGGIKNYIDEAGLRITNLHTGMESWCDLIVSTRFDTKWGDLQIDPTKVRAGDVVLLALKEDVKVGSTRQRLIAKWQDTTIRSPEACIEDGLRHQLTVCTVCLKWWALDYLIRSVPAFKHNTARAYDAFGCRCTRCSDAHYRYLMKRTPYSGEMCAVETK